MVDCEKCRIIYDNRTPCYMCRPEIHDYNIPVYELYIACSDQHIIGPSGSIGLNDVAITNAMKEYFEVPQKYKLKLSLKVRELANRIISISNAKAKEKLDRKNKK